MKRYIFIVLSIERTKSDRTILNFLDNCWVSLRKPAMNEVQIVWVVTPFDDNGNYSLFYFFCVYLCFLLHVSVYLILFVLLRKATLFYNTIWWYIYTINNNREQIVHLIHDPFIPIIFIQGGRRNRGKTLSAIFRFNSRAWN